MSQVNITLNTNTVDINTTNNQIVVTDPTNPNVVNITQPVTSVVEVITAGPQGPQGPQGEGANINTGSFATTGSNTFIGNQIVSGSVNISGSLNTNNTLYVTGSRVGIGTTTPTAILDVNGTSYLRGVALDGIFGYSGNNIAFSNSGNTTFIGNLGIGTSTPTYTLDVSGSGGTTARFRGTAGQATVSLNDGTTDNYIVAVSGRFQLRPSGNTTLTALSTGEIGIGITAPSSRLQVRGSGATTATTALRVENTNASASLVVLDNSNVGIGTSAPSYSLDISGTNWAGFRTAVPFQSETTANNYRYGALVVNNGYGAGGNANNTFDVFSVGQNTGVNNGIGFFRVNLHGGNSTGLYGASGANNSIAHLNATTTATLQVTAQNTGIAIIGSTSGTGATVTTIAAGSNLDLRSDNNGVFSGGGIRYYSSINGANHSHIWYHNASEQMRLTFGGNLGIGTSTPSASLHISGASSANLLRIDSPASSSIVFVSGSGNVGINTATPAYNLDVNGTARVQATNVVSALSITAATRGFYFTTNANGASFNSISAAANGATGNAGAFGFVISNGWSFCVSLNDTRDNSLLAAYPTANNVGQVRIGTQESNVSAILSTNSTTQGFLPPRMTNAQRIAISTPAVGLMVYCTDATEGLYVYKSTGWTFIV
jgi:hypothetical protein